MNAVTEAAEDVAQDVAHWFHRQPKESTVTDTATQTADASTAEPPVQTFLAALHQNMATFRSRIDQFLPVLERLALDPKFDSLVKAALLAANLGVAEEVFTGAVDMLNAAAAHRQDGAMPAGEEPAGPAPSFTPAQPPDGNGAQQVTS